MHIAPAQVLPILPQRGGWAVVSASKDEDRELRALASTHASANAANAANAASATGW